MPTYNIDVRITGTITTDDTPGTPPVLPPVNPPVEPPPVEPPPTEPPTEYDVDMSMGAEAMNASVEPTGENGAFYIKDLFTTLDGSWEVPDNREGNNIYGIEQRFRDRYLLPWGHPEYFDDAGGDHNAFALVLDKDGNKIKDAIIDYTEPGGTTAIAVKDKSGWGNIPYFNHFSPERGESGVWTWQPNNGAAANRAAGGGLPNNVHVSLFAVWQER